MHGLGDARKPRDEPVVKYGDLVRPGFAQGVDKGVPRDDKADLSLGEGPKKADLPIGDLAVLPGHIILRRRADEPVDEGDPAQGQRSQQDGSIRAFVHGTIVYKIASWVTRTAG